ncbi:MAG: hypothetical protein V1839_00315 [archaeon]
MVTFLAEAASTSSSIGIAPLDNVMTLLQNFGFFRVVLPFLLIFALIYAILMKTGVLGKITDPWMKTVPAIISMAIAFFVISSTPVVDLMMTLIPQASFILVVALFLLMIITFVAPTEFLTGALDKKWLIPLAIFLIVVFLGIIGAATPQIPLLHGIAQALMGNLALPELTSEVVSTIIAILVIFGIPVAIIAMVVMGSKTGPGKP